MTRKSIFHLPCKTVKVRKINASFLHSAMRLPRLFHYYSACVATSFYATLCLCIGNVNTRPSHNSFYRNTNFIANTLSTLLQTAFKCTSETHFKQGFFFFVFLCIGFIDEFAFSRINFMIFEKLPY